MIIKSEGKARKGKDMILADKIINERKKNGWSQEELAEMLSVSRQSVSKWEGAQAVPDLTKIIKMAEIFGVSTDYLLKDEIEEIERNDTSYDNKEELNLRKVSIEDAQRYIKIVKTNGGIYMFLAIKTTAEYTCGNLSFNFSGMIPYVISMVVTIIKIVSGKYEPDLAILMPGKNKTTNEKGTPITTLSQQEKDAINLLATIKD